jgi:hypothetical protein
VRVTRLRRIHEVLRPGRRVESGSSALGDRAVEEPLRRRRDEQRQDVVAPGGLAEDRHVARIPPEGLDVVAHPGEGADVIQVSEVARLLLRAGSLAQRSVSEPAEGTQSVVHHHHDDVMGRGEMAAVVEAGGADGVASAVDPEQNGQARVAGRHGVGGEGRGVDVQRQTVLVADQLSGPAAVERTP